MGPKLDLWREVRSTASVIFYDTHVMCQRIDMLGMKKHIKHMARQRCVGASDKVPAS